jgi:acetyltransferase
MEMVREIKGYPILEGVRGEPRCDIQGIVDALLKVSKLAMDLPEISELDLNPLMVYEKGVTAVDARIILSPSSLPEGH